MREHPIHTIITIIVLLVVGICGAFMGGIIGLLLIVACFLGAFYLIKKA